MDYGDFWFVISLRPEIISAGVVYKVSNLYCFFRGLVLGSYYVIYAVNPLTLLALLKSVIIILIVCGVTGVWMSDCNML